MGKGFNVSLLSRFYNLSSYPHGYYVDTLGEINDLETETKALLIENQIADNALPFSTQALSELPRHTADQPWKIPKEVSFFLKKS